MPSGYYLYDIINEGDTLVVAVDFSGFNKESAPFIEYKGEIYTRGSLVAIPFNMTSDVCSMREYHKKK